MHADDFVALCEHFSTVGNSLSAKDVRDVIRLSATLQKFMQDDLQRFITRHCEEPVMQVYINDGWSRMLNGKFTSTVKGSHLRVCRNGKLRHEFLLQRGIVRVNSLLGEELANIIVKEPIGMHLGKKTGHVFTASCEFLGTLRQSGCKGICINAYIQDGLLHSSLTRLFTARHVAYYLSGLDLGDSAAQFQDTDWTFSVKCSSHVCSNSLEKGFRVIPDKANTVNELHIVTASFINGSHNLYIQLAAFLLARLCFRDGVTGSIAERTDFWSQFVDDDSFLKIVVAADLWFNNGCLYVNECVQSWEDPLGNSYDIGDVFASLG